MKNFFMCLDILLAAVNAVCIYYAFESHHAFPWINVAAVIVCCAAAGFIFGGKK